MSFHMHRQNDLVWFTSDLLSCPHAFTTRAGGVSQPPWDSLNLGPGRGDNPEHVKSNYNLICNAVSLDAGYAVPAERVVLAKQVHETTVRVCTAQDAGKGLYQERDFTADGLITSESGLPLVVFSADCGIILLEDHTNGVIGAVHAGWRGCAGGIVRKAVEGMERRYGTRPEDLHAAVGPCIGQCCFETDHDVPDAMRHALGNDAEKFLYRQGRKWHVDLSGLNRFWLIRSGVPEQSIDACGLCTACHPELFWSHRKMGDRRGVQAALIMREADKS